MTDPAESLWARTQRDQNARIHDLFWERDCEILTNPASTEDDLLKLMDGIGNYSAEDRAALAQLLALHPMYSDDLARKAIKSLEAQWWGDNPVECSNGCRTLESILNK